MLGGGVVRPEKKGSNMERQRKKEIGERAEKR